LSTIEHADRIIYLEKGIKIAEGNKEELLKTCEPFRRMWEALYHTEKFHLEEELLAASRSEELDVCPN
jgi:ABC-type multidrug transport system ATPase subunit